MWTKSRAQPFLTYKIILSPISIQEIFNKKKKIIPYKKNKSQIIICFLSKIKNKKMQ
jgi:hypothetical protein